MKYISTRGQIEPVGFKDAVMMGLATDGGLLLPERIPTLSPATLDAWRELSYQQLAFELISLYATDIPADDLKELIDRSYATFDNRNAYCHTHRVIGYRRAGTSSVGHAHRNARPQT